MNRIDWPTASRFAGPQDSPGFLLWRRFHDWQRSVDHRLAPFDLTQLQFSVLAVAAWLARDGKPVIQQDIADLGKLDRMLVSQMVHRLEANGLLRRSPHGADRRAVSIALTKTGTALLTVTLPVVESHDAVFFSRTDEVLPTDGSTVDGSIGRS
jgi:DNA-binding MarR family transcriptional regulator